MRICADKVVSLSVDNLLSKGLSKNAPAHLVSFKGQIVTIYPNLKNIEKVKKFHDQGYFMMAWSSKGSEWAETVIQALSLQQVVGLTSSKIKPLKIK